MPDKYPPGRFIQVTKVFQQEDRGDGKFRASSRSRSNPKIIWVVRPLKAGYLPGHIQTKIYEIGYYENLIDSSRPGGYVQPEPDNRGKGIV